MTWGEALKLMEDKGIPVRMKHWEQNEYYFAVKIYANIREGNIFLVDRFYFHSSDNIINSRYPHTKKDGEIWETDVWEVYDGDFIFDIED